MKGAFAIVAAVGSLIALIPGSAPAQTSKFQIEEATIERIQAAIQKGNLTSTKVVQLYLKQAIEYAAWLAQEQVHTS